MNGSIEISMRVLAVIAFCGAGFVALLAIAVAEWTRTGRNPFSVAEAVEDIEAMADPGYDMRGVSPDVVLVLRRVAQLARAERLGMYAPSFERHQARLIQEALDEVTHRLTVAGVEPDVAEVLQWRAALADEEAMRHGSRPLVVVR